MDFQAFYQELRQGKLRNLYLFEGEEEYAKESALKDLRARIISGPLAMMNDSTLINPTDSQLIAACETLPIMEQRRLVVVKDSQQLLGKARASREDEAEDDEDDETDASLTAGKSTDDLVPYLDRLPDTVCLVFFIRGKASGTRKLYKKIKQLNSIVSFDPLSHEQLIKWVAKEARDYGKQIDHQTAEQLLFACGRDLLTLKGEIAKLAAHAGNNPVISQADLNAIASVTVEYKVFDLADKVAQGQAKEALPLMHEMLKSGEQRLMLLALLQRHYRQLVLCHLMNQGGQPQQAIASMLGIPGFVVKKLSQCAQAYTFPKLRDAYMACIEQEYLVKSGQVPEEGALEALVMKLLNLRKTSRNQQHA